MTYDPLARFLTQRSTRYKRRAKLRPMTSGELADMSIGLYQDLGGIILRYTAVPTLASLASAVFVLAYVFPALGVTSHPNDIHAQMGEVLVTVAVGFLVAAPLFALGLSYSGAFVTGLVSDYLNGEVPLPRVHAQAATKLLPKVLLLILYQLLTACLGLVIALALLMLSALLNNGVVDYSAALVSGVALTALIIGVIAMPFVLAIEILSLPVLVIEKTSPWQAIKRSKQLMKAMAFNPSGYNTAVSIMFLLLFVIVFVAGGLLIVFGFFGLDQMVGHLFGASPLRELTVQVLDSVPLFLTLWTAVPAWCVASTLLYYDRRTRLEGYDIELLARDMGGNVKQNRFDL